MATKETRKVTSEFPKLVHSNETPICSIEVDVDSLSQEEKHQYGGWEGVIKKITAQWVEAHDFSGTGTIWAFVERILNVDTEGHFPRHFSERIIMNHKTMSMIVLPLLAAIVAGCANEPPKCSDESTFSLIRQIIVDQLGGREGVTDNELQENMKIELPRASAFDEKIKKYSCEAKLIAGGTIQLPITYESQLDDKNQHIVSVGGISRGDLYRLQNAITNGIKEGREVKKGGATPQPQTVPPAKSSSPSVSGTWKGSLEGDGEMEIKPAATGFDVALSVSNPSGCTGSLESSASLVNDVLTLTKKEYDQVCTVTIKFSGDTAELNENNCSDYHGAACGFSGALNRQK